MNEQLMKQVLNHLADTGIPTNYDPFPLVNESIGESILFHKAMKSTMKRRPVLRFALVISLLIILAGILIFLTPQGRGVAQDIIKFFTFAENDFIPMPIEYATETPPPTRTAAPSYLIELKKVIPIEEAPSVLSYPTSTPVLAQKKDAPIWNLSLEEAEQLAGSELRVPHSLPPGYRLDNVTYDPKSREVTQIYGFHPYSAGEQFILHQRPSNAVIAVGQSANVEVLTIGKIQVEYVSGSWIYDANTNTERWAPNSIFHTFRWQEGDSFFTLEILFDESDTWSPAYWTMDGMQALLELIMGVRETFPVQINPNNLSNIAQAESLAGFELLTPSILPEGFIFNRAVYNEETGQVIQFYQPEDGSRASSGVRLLVIQGKAMDQPQQNWSAFPEEAIERVIVNGNQALFVQGAIVDGVYDPNAQLSLEWNQGDLLVRLVYFSPLDYPARLDKDDLMAIARELE